MLKKVMVVSLAAAIPLAMAAGCSNNDGPYEGKTSPAAIDESNVQRVADIFNVSFNPEYMIPHGNSMSRISSLAKKAKYFPLPLT